MNGPDDREAERQRHGPEQQERAGEALARTDEASGRDEAEGEGGEGREDAGEDQRTGMSLVHDGRDAERSDEEPHPMSPRAGEHEGQDEERHAQQDASRPDEGAPQQRTDRREGEDQREHRARPRSGDAHPGEEPPAHVEEERVPGGHEVRIAREWRRREPADRVESVGAVMLQRAPRQVRDVVEWGVVRGHSTDEGEVQARHAALPPHRVIGVVGHAPVDLDGGRGRARSAGLAREALHRPAVPRPGLEHAARSRIAASFQVDHRADARAEGMVLGEELGAEQALLLAVLEQEDDVSLERRSRGQRARHLEPRRDAREVVLDAGPREHRVVVGHAEDRVAPEPPRRVPSPGSTATTLRARFP